MILFNYNQYHKIVLENNSEYYEATALQVVNTFQYLPLKRLLDF